MFLRRNGKDVKGAWAIRMILMTAHKPQGSFETVLCAILEIGPIV